LTIDDVRIDVACRSAIHVQGVRRSVVVVVGEADFAEVALRSFRPEALPVQLEQKLQSGKYRAATVGACDAGTSGRFTHFRIAVLLY
jgi:hypothetical protein